MELLLDVQTDTEGIPVPGTELPQVRQSVLDLGRQGSTVCHMCPIERTPPDVGLPCETQGQAVIRHYP